MISLGEALKNKEVSDFLINSFACPVNKEIELFLKEKAVTFEKRELAKTFLVYNRESDGYQHLLGYFALGIKSLNTSHVTSKTLKKKVTGSTTKDDNAVLLLGQIGRNFNETLGVKNPISGDGLISLALQTLLEANAFIGGRVVLVECKDISHLRQFYEQEGFQYLDKEDDLLRYILPISVLKRTYH